MQIFFEQSDRSSHEYPEQYLYLGLPWKDYRLCTKQFLPQNYHRTFPQFREIGWYLTWKYFKILRSWNYLFRSTAHRKACFLYCGWYHSFKDKAFVTGSASNWRCVFPLWLLVCFWNNNQHICTEGVPYHWSFKNKPPAVPVRNEKEAQQTCCWIIGNREGIWPCDSQKLKILCVPVWRKPEWYRKCGCSFKLSWKGIWKSQSTAGFYQHKRGIINARDPFLLCVQMADWGLFQTM